MTIAIISMIRDSWGGSEELWYDMAKIALTKGHKVIHLGYEHPKKHTKLIELENLSLIHYERPGWIPTTSNKGKRILYTAWNFIRKKLNPPIKKIIKENPDIIIYNGTCYSIADEKELLKFIRGSKKKISFYIIGHLNNESQIALTNFEADKIRFAYNFSNHVFFVSHRNLETAKRHLCYDISNAVIIRNPINISSIEPIPYPSSVKGVKFACVGNLVIAHKGQDILLAALSKWDIKDWELNIYGNGSDLKYLQSLVKYFQIEDRVIFHGSVSDVRKIWEKNHALLMSSHMEGMPLAVVEAMLCARMCIATDVGGISEWIKDGVNGYIAEAPTVASITNALNRAWKERHNWTTMSGAAREDARRLYDPNAGLTLLNRIIA